MHALLQGRRQTGRIDPGAGVESDDIARRTGPAGQHVFNGRQALVDGVDLEGLQGTALQAEILRGQAVGADFALLEFSDLGRGADADFVQAVLGMHHHHMATAQALQHMGQRFHPAGGEYAHDLVGRAGGIGERPQQVEDRAHSHLPPWADGVFHGAMVQRREQETDADGFDAGADLFRAQFQPDSGGFQHIRAAGSTGDGTIAVLGHFAPAAAATRALAVEILKVPAASPPVPQVSNRCGLRTSTRMASSRMTWAAAAISSTVSPFMCRPTRKPPICAGLA